jgi:hypothetical protein
MTTLDELIYRLEEIREELTGSTIVRGVFQPNYPLVADIDAITTLVTWDSGKSGVYLALGSATEYGTSEMWADDFVSLDDDDAAEDDD